MSSTKQIEKTLSPCNKDIDFLTQKINAETPEYGVAHPFAFFIRDDKMKIIAGANGLVIYGEIYTAQLWVDPYFRKQGLGHKLMAQVHELGKSEDCKLAVVQTMSFQGAIDFYTALGYEIDFERPGYVRGSRCLFLKKDL